MPCTWVRQAESPYWYEYTIPTPFDPAAPCPALLHDIISYLTKPLGHPHPPLHTYREIPPLLSTTDLDQARTLIGTHTTRHNLGMHA